jgi:branched-chain amino acid transport system ATP-binding protein
VRRLLLKIDGIDVCYGKFQALHSASLQVDAKELVTVIGTNGAGKTTLLNTIVGLLRPTKGQIRLEEERIDGLPAYQIVQKGIVLVPEGRGIFTRLTVLENLQVGAYSKKAREKYSETLKDVFELFPRLGERKSQKAGTLSGGEQQMLAVGRGLMECPKLLMLDEPSLGLAPKLVLETFSTLKRLKEEAITILLVEQNARRALALSDRAYLLEEGHVALQGEAQQLLQDEYVKKSYLGI